MEPYNADWPKQFAQIPADLAAQLRGFKDVKIAHIGSTAVLNLSARPVIDILVTAPSLDIDDVTTTLAESGVYDHQDDPRHPNYSFLVARSAPISHAIYLCPNNSLLARAHLAIRDTLRSDSELQAYYTDPKNRASEATNEGVFQACRDVQTSIQQHILIASQQFSTQELAALFLSDESSRWAAISTERLVLREYEVEDVKGMYLLESNPSNARYQSWHPWNYLEARQNVLRGILRGFEKDRAVVELAVVHEGSFVGRIGANVQRSVSPCTGDNEEMRRWRPAKHADLWYSFLPSAQGKGLATEAMRAFVDELVKRNKEEGEFLELEIECDPRNVGSWKMAERLGLEKETLTERAWECKGEWVDSLVYRKIV
jgi:RimJ/RimL family protein N-acetyltransferase